MQRKKRGLRLALTSALVVGGAALLGGCGGGQADAGGAGGGFARQV